MERKVDEWEGEIWMTERKDSNRLYEDKLKVVTNEEPVTNEEEITIIEKTLT